MLPPVVTFRWAGLLANMRIQEILESADPEERKHESVLNLLNLLRTKADQQGVAAVLPVSSFFKLLSNVGYNLTLPEFEHLQGSVPSIGSLVKSVDDKTITIASNKQPSEPSSEVETDASEPAAGDSSTVRKMAARAAKRKD